MTEGVVELEGLILDKLRDAVNFVLAVVHYDIGVGRGDDVDFTTCEL